MKYKTKSIEVEADLSEQEIEFFIGDKYFIISKSQFEAIFEPSKNEYDLADSFTCGRCKLEYHSCEMFSCSDSDPTDDSLNLCKSCARGDYMQTLKEVK